MVVYYGEDTGNYAARINTANYTAYQDLADSRPYALGTMPYYGTSFPNSASATSLRPDATLEPRGRHRSTPSPARHDSSSRRRRERSPCSSHPPVDPVRRAQSVVKDTFTNSTSGVGVGVLGAIIGGLVAREASEAAASSNNSFNNQTVHSGRRRHHHHQSDQHSQENNERTRLILTLVGAAVGGLGANALEKRIEVARERTAEEEQAWEKKWGRNSRGRRTDRMEDVIGPDDDRDKRRSHRRRGDT